MTAPGAKVTDAALTNGSTTITSASNGFASAVVGESVAAT